jgi:hypothetical protein
MNTSLRRRKQSNAQVAFWQDRFTETSSLQAVPCDDENALT